MKKTASLLGLLILFTALPAYGRIEWINELDKGLSEARDRDAPILAFFWDYN